MSRGDHGEVIFRDDQDRIRFLETFEEVCEKTGWRVHAYVLMPNHYHLLLETPQANLVAGMKWFQGTYTQRFNSRHRVRGHLVQGRYKAVVVEAERDYFAVVSTYVHLNPVRARLVKVRSGQKLRGYRWSSFPAYVTGRRPTWLEVERVLSATGAGKDNQAARRRYEA
jgi:REP element-mobilizing transposase RayT